ncbi:zinc finger BED domain-containing protein RICESLEEPER 2-like [Nicotiana tomentosiformis]|uniref:zinc finger BED domain-containing protein RICESLEEPER 2-like n=1 Tax=Nicotiana tomentosiformis TaxID=4098 RepID=UPI00388C839C
MGTNLMNSNHLHVRYMAHIMNLVVQDSLKESSVSIERVRHAVRYVRQSPARLKRFQECFDDKQLNCKKTLCLDVPTRWNSTYLMLRRAVEFESAFSHYASSEIGLRHYLGHSYIEVGIPTCELLSSDWENVKGITKFLEIFYLLTLKISGSRSVTSNIYFLEIYAVAIYLKQLIANEDTVLSEMAKKMNKKFNKYWGDPGKMNKIVFISSRFPVLAEMARDVLAVPISSVASECAFSTGGRLLDLFRSSLTPKLVQALVCLQDWLQNEKLKQPVSVEEDINKIEQLEQDLASDGKDPSVIDV